jgi:hypothetical protein
MQNTIMDNFLLWVFVDGCLGTSANANGELLRIYLFENIMLSPTFRLLIAIVIAGRMVNKFIV